MILFNFHKTLRAAGGDMSLQVDCRLEPGQFATVYGESGAGKTSILRILAGLLQPESGFIEVNGKVWLDSSRKINLPIQQRSIGFVFQDYALFPNMTVRENLRYALSKRQDPGIVDQLIGTVELQALQDRRPDSLSGGQKQRVALARALVRQPQLLLLDEPLSALDEGMRAKLQDYILEVHRQFGLTTLLVSHDIGEIFKMSQKIFVLNQGRIEREGSPEEVFTQSRLSGKFRFTGTILDIRADEVVFIISVLAGNQVIRVIATHEEAESMRPGDKVVVVSKAFNPLIMKVD